MNLKMPPPSMQSLAETGKEKYKELLDHEFDVDAMQSGYMNNDAEIQATLAVKESIAVEATVSEDSIQLQAIDSNLPWAQDMQNGIDAPYLGGNNGTVTMPDHSTRPTRVPRELWEHTKHTIDEYAASAFTYMENARIRAETLVPDICASKAQEMAGDIVEYNKDVIEQEVTSELGGT